MKAINQGAPPGRVTVYGLLLVGALVFSWPFLWMLATSAKTDQELATTDMGNPLDLRPRAPAVPTRSPYVDTRALGSPPPGARKIALGAIATRLGTLDLPWDAGGLNRAAAITATARGVLRRLEDRLPASVWTLPAADQRAEMERAVDAPLAAEVFFARVRRAVLLGPLRVRSVDLQEDVFEADDGGWEIVVVPSSSPDATTLVPTTADAGRRGAEWRYDFSRVDQILLTRTLPTSFPVARLARVQLSMRPDDSWHALGCAVERAGVRLRAVRPADLSGDTWTLLTWQEPGPDDATNRIRTWTLLRPETAATAATTGPGGGENVERDRYRLRVTLELRRRSALTAWWAKGTANYRLALAHVPLGRYVATSLFLAVLNVVGALFSCSLTAYGFARLRWPGRGLCFALLLATMMVPGQVTMIPQFLLAERLGWYNTLTPLWIGAWFAPAFNVFLLRQFLRGIPRDLEDAARIDGCGFWRVYWHLMLPLVRPTLAAIAVFTFLGSWNDFLGPLLYLRDQRLYPLGFGLFALNVQDNGGSMGMMMAGSLLMTLPVIGVFLFAQRYFLQGITLTGVKG